MLTHAGFQVPTAKQVPHSPSKSCSLLTRPYSTGITDDFHGDLEGERRKKTRAGEGHIPQGVLGWAAESTEVRVGVTDVTLWGGSSGPESQKQELLVDGRLVPVPTPLATLDPAREPGGRMRPSQGPWSNQQHVRGPGSGFLHITRAPRGRAFGNEQLGRFPHVPAVGAPPHSEGLGIGVCQTQPGGRGGRPLAVCAQIRVEIRGWEQPCGQRGARVREPLTAR